MIIPLIAITMAQGIGIGIAGLTLAAIGIICLYSLFKKGAENDTDPESSEQDDEDDEQSSEDDDEEEIDENEPDSRRDPAFGPIIDPLTRQPALTRKRGKQKRSIFRQRALPSGAADEEAYPDQDKY